MCEFFLILASRDIMVHLLSKIENSTSVFREKYGLLKVSGGSNKLKSVKILRAIMHFILTSLARSA